MRTISLVLLASTFVVCGQTVQRKSDPPYAITTKDANSQVWERTAYELSPDGKQVPKVHRYTELATGLNYLKDGEWTASREEITILPQGGAAATQGQHQVYFPGNIYQGQIELVTPDGKHLKSRPLGLSYDDGQNTVLIAELKDSTGYLVSSNQIVYPDAFTDFKADLRYTYTKSGFEQDIILREQPPIPAMFNMDADQTHLQLLTEFFDTTQPKQQKRKGDTELSFGTMKMIQGKAFLTNNDNDPSLMNGIPVSKSWQKVAGRDFLVEELPVSDMAEELEALPEPPQQLSRNNSSIRNRLSSTRLLPPIRLAQATTNTIQLAQSDFNQQKGFVLDYVTINANQTDFVFQGDTTYLISGIVNLYGTNTFEGGTVIKYADGGGIYFQLYWYSPSALNWRATSYRPVILTSLNDDTVGEVIADSTGNPTWDYFPYPEAMLRINGDVRQVISNLRASYGFAVIKGSAPVEITDSQFKDCYYVFWNAYQEDLKNVLIENVQACFVNQQGPVTLQNGTIHHASYIYDGTWNIMLTNCILANVTNATGGSGSYSGDHNGFFMTKKFGLAAITNTFYPFQSGSGGDYYLTNGCSFIDAGGTTADQVGLYHFTTQANQVKETNSIVDLGYHYVAADNNGNPIDTDGDGVPDYLVDANGNGLVDPGEVDWRNSADSDGDGLSDAYEKFISHTDPNNPDSDGDGIADSDEILDGTDPHTAESAIPSVLDVETCPQ